MHKIHMPAKLRVNTNYSHGIEAGPNMRFLAIAGQTGQGSDGSIADGIEAQADLAWGAVIEVLKEAGMGPEHLLHYTSYLTNPEDNDGYNRARIKWLGDIRPASTKVFISGLARPELLCEVQAFAAAPA